MTASSDDEERERAGRLVYSLETVLRESGAVVELGEPFACQVVVDGLLVTGQNEASAEPAARKLLGLIAGRS
jgi:putative intracellular protease/amidase